MNKDFKDLGLSEDIVKAIKLLNFTKPSEIQEKMIPLIMDNKDLIGQAETGSGKTLAYAASILSKINMNDNITKALILTPTRELALQVCEDFEQINNNKNFDILAVYGGSSIDEQIKKLKKGIDVVVGTPGRVMDLIRRKKLYVNSLEVFVLDEADEMLDMGFLEDMESIFKETNKNKQVLMLSATMPKQIESLAKNYMKPDYQHIIIESDTKTNKNIKQYYYLTNEKSRNEVLCRVLDIKNTKRTLIFCQTKKECDELLMDLSIRGYNAEAMHGDVIQSMRIKTLDRFKQGAFNFLIATDIAARGIHVDNIELVINYKLPQDFETYIHRIGRTARAGNSGEAISLVNNRELKTLKDIEKFINANILEQQLPSKDEIINIKYQSLIDEAMKEENIDKATEYVRDLNKGDLITLSASLLKMTVAKQIGSNLNKEIKIEERLPKKVDNNSTRVFITIGKKDNLKKGSLLDFIKDELKMRKDDFNNIEVLSTFTFIDVNNNVVDKFMNVIKGKKFNNRIIRIEKAKRQK